MEKVIDKAVETKKVPASPKPNKDEKSSSTIEKPKEVEPDNTDYTYKYILCTPEQKKAIDLNKSKAKLEKLFKGYFQDRLVSVVIETNSYILTLTGEFKTGEKRQLGRQVGLVDDLKSHAKKVYYNNNQDFSTQLFKLKQTKKES